MVEKWRQASVVRKRTALESARQKKIISQIMTELKNGNILSAQSKLKSTVGVTIISQIEKFKYQQSVFFLKVMKASCNKVFLAGDKSSQEEKLKAVTSSLFISVCPDSFSITSEVVQFSDFLQQFNNNPAFVEIFLKVLSNKIEYLVYSAQKSQAPLNVETIHAAVAALVIAGPEALFAQYTYLKLTEVKLKPNSWDEYKQAAWGLKIRITPPPTLTSSIPQDSIIKTFPGWNADNIKTANDKIQSKLALELPDFVDNVKDIVKTDIRATIKQLLNSFSEMVSAAFKSSDKSVQRMSIRMYQARSRASSLNTNSGDIELKSAPQNAALFNKVDELAASLSSLTPAKPAHPNPAPT